MSKTTAISWCDSTFNPWVGCTKVSPACDNCYAERLMDHRMRKAQWGAGKPRVRTSASNWRAPLRWNAKRFMQCEDCGWRGEAETPIVGCGACGSIELSDTRRRVFCASLADVFDHEVDPTWRADLFAMIDRTPHLDWLLLTKRIGNARTTIARPNVWLGATICNQEEADRDIPKLLATPARMRFLSVEPMLGPVRLDLLNIDAGDLDFTLDSLRGRHPMRYGHCDGARLDWVICGGESGPHARPMHPDWVRQLRDQCADAGVPFHFKQWGEFAHHSVLTHDQIVRSVCVPMPGEPRSDDAMVRVGTKAAGRHLDGVEHNGVPR